MDNFLFDKKRIFVSVLVFLLLFSCYGIYLFIQNNNENTEIKLSRKMTEEKKIDGLLITDIKPYRIQKVNHLSFKITNNTDTIYQSKKMTIVFLDNKKNVLSERDIMIVELLPGGITGFDLILSNQEIEAYDFLLASK